MSINIIIIMRMVMPLTIDREMMRNDVEVLLALKNLIRQMLHFSTVIVLVGAPKRQSMQMFTFLRRAAWVEHCYSNGTFTTLNHLSLPVDPSARH